MSSDLEDCRAEIRYQDMEAIVNTVLQKVSHRGKRDHLVTISGPRHETFPRFLADLQKITRASRDGVLYTTPLET